MKNDIIFKSSNGTEAKIILDSENPYNGIRLTTMQLRYPRFIHAELMTHRVFSRNASSSRAIPVEKMIKQVIEEPATPIHWGANQPGMQADIELSEPLKDKAILLWKSAALRAASVAQEMHNLGLHKQVANRILEPFQFISVVLTATEWDNWFALRSHPDAQPEIRDLSDRMADCLGISQAIPREYHLPYVSDEEIASEGVETCFKLSTARCARVSYLTHDGQTPDIQKDIALYERLVGSVPIHASPTEHPAMGVLHTNFIKNFRGWYQHRCAVENTVENTVENAR